MLDTGTVFEWIISVTQLELTKQPRQKGLKERVKDHNGRYKSSHLVNIP